MKPIKALIILTLFLNSIFSYAQYIVTIEAFVLDKKTNEPVPYVNIGFVNKRIGTVSDENGKFTLSYYENSVIENDVLQFSRIGFETVQFNNSELTQLLTSNNKIFLNQKIYSIDEVILDFVRREEKRIGNSKVDKESFGYWKDKKALGGEIATLIKIKKRNTRLLDLKFNILENLSDSLKLRINIYDYHKGFPSKNLLIKNIFYSISNKNGTVTIDLEPYNIKVDHDIVVGLELIKVYGDKIGFALSASKRLSIFTNGGIPVNNYSNIKSSGISFTRYISQDKWKRYPLIGMNFSLLLSYPVNKNKDISIEREKPAKITLYWDRSLSLNNRPLDMELEFLSKYLKKLKPVDVEVIKFNNALSNPKIFHITKNNRNELLNYLRNTRYEGTVNYSNILQHNNFNADIALLFTDGNDFYSPLIPAVYIPVFSVNSKSNANHLQLQKVATYGDGYYINLNKVSLKQALESIQNEVNDYTDYTNLNYDSIKKEKEIHGKIYSSAGPLQSATVRIKNTLKGTETDEDGYFTIDAQKGDVLLIDYLGMFGKQITVTDKKEIIIELVSGAEILQEVVVTGEGKKEEKLIDLGLGGKKNFDAIGTSVNTITEKDIGPQYNNLADLLRGKFAGIQISILDKDTPVVKLRNQGSMTNEVAAIYDIDGQIFDTNQQRIPRIDPQDVATISILKSLAAVNKYGTIGRGGVIVIKTKTYSGAKTAEPKKSVLAKNNDYTEQVPLTRIVANKPSYINALERAGSYKEALSIYDLQKALTKQVGIPFYIDVSQYFIRWDKDFALSILSNIAEVAYNSVKALKTLAYKYEQFNKPQDAKLIYQRIAVLKPKDAQSYRDLAHIYTKTDNFKEAMQLYKQMLYNQVESVDFTALQKTIESEIKHLVTVHRDKVNFKELPGDYLAANFKNNTRIVFEWNDPYAEFELQFVNPQKKFFKWSHTKTSDQEGMLDEIKNGYYTEEYIIDDENSGEWIINIQSNNEEEFQNPTYLKYTIYQNYGLANETKTIKVIKLYELQQKVTLDKFVSSNGKSNY